MAFRLPSTRGCQYGFFQGDTINANSGLQELFLDELRGLYSAEHQVLKELPKMAEAASAPDLQKAFQTHKTQTEAQIQRLEQVFKLLKTEPKSKRHWLRWRPIGRSDAVPHCQRCETVTNPAG